jgi:hypothetical protein
MLAGGSSSMKMLARACPVPPAQPAQILSRAASARKTRTSRGGSVVRRLLRRRCGKGFGSACNRLVTSRRRPRSRPRGGTRGVRVGCPRGGVQPSASASKRSELCGGQPSPVRRHRRGGPLTRNSESRNEAERLTKTCSSESSSGVLTGRAAAAALRIMTMCGRAIVPRTPTMREAAGAAQYAGRVPGRKGAARRTRRRGQGRRARSQSDVMVIVVTSLASECGGRGKCPDRLFPGSQRCDLDRYFSKAWERKL